MIIIVFIVVSHNRMVFCVSRPYGSTRDTRFCFVFRGNLFLRADLRMFGHARLPADHCSSKVVEGIYGYSGTEHVSVERVRYLFHKWFKAQQQDQQ
uniref:Putative secreted peptide n=1 Tax=Anopheles braziliensis TaxID=58242 RepID=A0A2M3ZXX7_9DIPT